jgi:DNA-binding transcriptional regulator YiaG
MFLLAFSIIFRAIRIRSDTPRNDASDTLRLFSSLFGISILRCKAKLYYAIRVSRNRKIETTLDIKNEKTPLLSSRKMASMKEQTPLPNQALIQARKSRNWTQRQLAEQLQVGLNAVRAWEANLRVPSLVMSTQLCSLFAMTPAELGLSTTENLAFSL